MIVTKKYINEISYRIIKCAIEVHKQLGPGLLESIYEACLLEELKLNGLDSKSQLLVPVIYKGIKAKDDLKLDILVNNLIIVELKAAEAVHPVHQAILLSYMKLAEKPKGLLINFHVVKLIDGVTSLVNDIFANLPD